MSEAQHSGQIRWEREREMEDDKRERTNITVENMKRESGRNRSFCFYPEALHFRLDAARVCAVKCFVCVPT